MLGFGLCALALVILLVIMVGDAYNWFNNASQTQAAVYSNAPLTQQQQQELVKVHLEHRQAFATKKDWEVSFTPELVNAFIAAEVRKQNERGTASEMVGADLHFDGDKTTIRFTLKLPDGNFLNFEVRGEPSFENGVFKGNVDRIKMAGQEPPFLVRLWLNTFVAALKHGEFRNADDPNSKNPFEALKLVRREGDHIRVIIDGNHVPDPDKNKDGVKDGGTVAPTPEL